MKTPRPAPPRTLADPPPAPSRSPRSAAARAVFPALTAALASGLTLPACHETECGSTRADEIERHGPLGVRALGEGHASRALREIGVAVGAVDHEHVAPQAVVQGGGVAVAPVPVHTRGGGGVRPPVETTPTVVPQPPVTQPHHPPRTTRPAPPRRTAGTPPRTTPAPREALRGDMKAVGPLPLLSSDRRRA